MTSEVTVLVTGATDGIGLQTAIDLARAGAKLALHGRSPSKLSEAARSVEAARSGSVAAQLCADLASLAEVRRLAAEVQAKLPRLDVLLANAGVFKKSLERTVDGFEATFAVNHLSHLLLCHELMPMLRRSAGSRVVVVSSMAHGQGRVDFDDLTGEKHFSGYGAYALSKLANVLFTVELARRTQGHPTANSLHPGVVGTNLLREGFGSSGRESLSEGAETSVYLCLSPDVADKSGAYFVRKSPAPMHKLAADESATARFYERSCELVGVAPLPE
ncbi:MAG: SDR family oxidoreductase [Polyangiaceae bacterium]|jgi:retinol dehydrogenase-14|nr:SDR family oxidoreductase [Polyangiaceae bacterium]